MKKQTKTDNFFDVPVKNKEEKYKKIIEISKNDCITCNLLDYEYCSKHYKLIAIDLNQINWIK